MADASSCYKRPIHSILSTTQTTALPTPLPDLRDWVAQQLADPELDLRWLLAHCSDGVIWGVVDQGALKLSCDQGAFPERGLSLRWPTLQQCRIFGPAAELVLWRGPEDAWHATLRRDGVGDPVEYIDEAQLLWGYYPPNATPTTRGGFLWLVEGSQGIAHAPPISTAPLEHKRAPLQVRHYLAEDESGVTRIVASRLRSLDP